MLLNLRLVLWLAVIPMCFPLRSLFDRTDLPRLKDTDSIEVYHLRSFPAMLIETGAGAFSTQSSGLALRSTTSNQIIVLEYKPKSYAGCFLPIIEVGDDGQYSLYWDKSAELVYHDQIDTVYWQQSTFLAHINGIVYKNYVVWIQSYMQRNRLFSPQSICNSEREFNCYFVAETWDTFLHDTLKMFATFSVQINAIIPPRATELRLLTGSLPLLVQASAWDSSSEENGEGELSPRRRHESGEQVDSQSSRIDASHASNQEEEGSPSDDIPSRRLAVPTALQLPRTLGAATSSAATPSGRRLRRAGHNASHAMEYEDPMLVNVGGTHQGGDVEHTSQVALPQVPVSEVVSYYQDLMSCMQAYQLSDFTNALKSCISQVKAYVHVKGDKYFAFKPRYPFVYVNDYLQEIPQPAESNLSAINSLDGSILACMVLVSLLGCAMMMHRMNVCFCPAASSFCGVLGSTSSSSASHSHSESVHKYSA